MAPLRIQTRAPPATFGNRRDVDNIESYIIEGWGEGFMFGSLLIMAVITVANMRRGVLLHKMILLELLLAMSHGTFCFMSFNGYGYYLSSTAALLYCSYFTHNVVAWMKIRPFFSGAQPVFSPAYSKWVRRIYLNTLAMTIPVLMFEIFNNFRFFNNFSELYATVRPYEPLMRDPWWIFSCATLFHVIRKSYSLNVTKLIRKSPRFGIMLVAIFLAIIFTVVDILSTIVRPLSVTDGINPYWKLALVFKCLTDNILLDDFKSVLQRLGAMKTDGRGATMPDLMEFDTHDKKSAGAEHREGQFPSLSAYPEEEGQIPHQIGLNTALPDEHLGGSTHPYKQSNEAPNRNGIGKLGVRIKRLPRLPYSAHDKDGSKEH